MEYIIKYISQHMEELDNNFNLIPTTSILYFTIYESIYCYIIIFLIEGIK